MQAMWAAWTPELRENSGECDGRRVAGEVSKDPDLGRKWSGRRSGDRKLVISAKEGLDQLVREWGNCWVL